MNTRKFLLSFVISGLLLISCSDDDDNPDPVNPEEVITTMVVTLIDGSDVVTLRFFDEDGDDPTDPVVTVSGPLKSNTTYNGSIRILNETEDPAGEVNDEIKEEAEEHQFFYITDDLGITTAYADKESDYVSDAGDNPVGIEFTLTTTEQTGDADLKVELRHEPNKEAEGVADGDITNAGGEPDIEWTFNIEVD